MNIYFLMQKMKAIEKYNYTGWSKYYVNGPDYVTFYGSIDPFSNWHHASFSMEFNKVQYQFHSSEQALMFAKACLFDDNAVALKILKTNDQKLIKNLGRQVSNYDEFVWSEKRLDIMTNILIHKFEQNSKLLCLLLSTGDKVIIEASPYDKIWGVGSGFGKDPKGLGHALLGVTADKETWNGLNLLGTALMNARTHLKKEYYVL